MHSTRYSAVVIDCIILSHGNNTTLHVFIRTARNGTATLEIIQGLSQVRTHSHDARISHISSVLTLTVSHVGACYAIKLADWSKSCSIHVISLNKCVEKILYCNMYCLLSLLNENTTTIIIIVVLRHA